MDPVRRTTTLVRGMINLVSEMTKLVRHYSMWNDQSSSRDEHLNLSSDKSSFEATLEDQFYLRRDITEKFDDQSLDGLDELEKRKSQHGFARTTISEVITDPIILTVAQFDKSILKNPLLADFTTTQNSYHLAYQIRDPHP